MVRLAAIVLAALLAGKAMPRAEEKPIPPCREDAMVVFDASGSMSGNETLGIPNSRARIDEARSALAQVLPNAAKFRHIGLVTYGPGPWNQCNVKLNFKPMPNAALQIMSAVNSIVPAGKTPLTQGIEEAAEALDFRTKPGVIVVITDGEETGLRGARAFAERHPLMRRVGVVVNLEARGASGPSMMFETGPGNARLMDLFARAVARPSASSVSYEVYKLLPNDTDFSVYRKLGLSGFNFGFTNSAALYHSTRDNLQYLDRRSLQHMGEHAFEVTGVLADADLATLTAQSDASFFDSARTSEAGRNENSASDSETGKAPPGS
jgi:hypothetical protein